MFELRIHREETMETPGPFPFPGRRMESTDHAKDMFGVIDRAFGRAQSALDSLRREVDADPLPFAAAGSWDPDDGPRAA